MHDSTRRLLAELAKADGSIEIARALKELAKAEADHEATAEARAHLREVEELGELEPHRDAVRSVLGFEIAGHSHARDKAHQRAWLLFRLAASRQNAAGRR